MPSLTLVAAAEAAPPLRRRHHRPFESVTLCLPVFCSLVLPPPRDWAELPPELLSCILHKLDHVQIMLGADKVCRSWRRAARDEPELWRRIDMRGYKALSNRNLVDLSQMAVEAVRRSQGQCQAFSGEGDGLHDDFILFLGNHAPLLKRLILVSCGGISSQGFMLMQAIKGFPLLEELHLSKCWYLQVQRAGVYEVIAKECPRIKYLRICDVFDDYYSDIADRSMAIGIAKMQELRSLQLINNYSLRNQGLATFLDNCLHLKSLDILNCYNIDMTPEMEARIKAKKLLINYNSNGRWDGFDEPGSPMSECSTCFNYFGPNNEERYKKRYPYNHYGIDDKQIYPRDEREAMVISAVRELRSLELYRNDLTSKGLAAVLDKCPNLEPLDVWNCLNIVGNTNYALRAKWHRIKTKKGTTLRATPKWHQIKTKKMTIKLLMNRSNHNVFNPEGLDIRYCRSIVMNSCHGRRIIMDNTLGAKYKRLKLRRWAKKYHKRTKKMKARIEQYLAELPGGNVDYMEFEGAEFGTYRYYSIISNPNNFWLKSGYEDNYLYYCVSDRMEFEPGSRISECSTCLMFEYLAERWGVLDLDDYADYYDSSYGLGIYDEIEFQVHHRMLGKRFRRYMKME